MHGIKEMNIHEDFSNSSDGFRIVYRYTNGHRPVVLLHGLTADGLSWVDAGHFDLLAESGFRPIAVDLRGHGSSQSSHDPADYAGRRLVDDVIGVLNALGIDKADIIGHSLGGVIALQMIAFCPGRVRTGTIVGAHPLEESVQWLRDLFATGLGPWVSAITSHAGPLPKRLIETISAIDPEVVRALLTRDRPDFSATVIASPVPVCYIAGSDEERMPIIQNFAQRSGASFKAIPGCNHFNTFLAADEIVRAFLENAGKSAQPSTGASVEP